MSAHAVPLRAPARPVRGLGRLRPALATAGAAVLRAAPHVLHHAGPLAGAALLAGAGGKLLFGALGFLAAIPMLRRIHRHTGSWRVPGALLAVMTAMFTFSSLVIGPALTDSRESSKPAKPGPTQPLPAGHESHHR